MLVRFCVPVSTRLLCIIATFVIEPRGMDINPFLQIYMYKRILCPLHPVSVWQMEMHNLVYIDLQIDFAMFVLIWYGRNPILPYPPAMLFMLLSFKPIHYSDVTLCHCHSKSPTSRLDFQHLNQANNREHSKAPHYWSFVGRIHRSQRASDTLS